MTMTYRDTKGSPLTFAEVDANFRDVFGRVTNVNLLALSGLAGVADRLPYFTGAGAMSLGTLTAFSRTLLAQADAVGWRGPGGLGLGTAALAALGVANGAASLGADGKIPLGQLPAGTASGVASLGADGKIPTSQLPPLAVNEVFTVASQAAMLALVAERGDVAIRTDQAGKAYILTADAPAVLANWVSLDQALSLSLAALNALTPAANKVPYFTGTSTAGLLDLTTDVTDSVAGRLMKIGDHGIGVDSNPAVYELANLDATTIAPGEWRIGSSTAGTKPFAFGQVKVWRQASTIICQFAQSFTTDVFAFRRYSGGAWGAWKTTVNVFDYGVGALGAGTVTVWPQTSINNVTGIGQGFYSTSGAITNLPPGFSPATIHYAVRTGDGSTSVEVTQTLVNMSGQTATRGALGGSAAAPNWSAWVISGQDIGSINGLQLQFKGGNALTISTGSATLPDGSRITVSSPIVKTGIAFAASTMYYIYLYMNAGVPDIEITSTVAPVKYFGTAHYKTNDPARRYLGSVLTGTGAGMFAFKHNPVVNDIDYFQGTPIAAPFKLVSSFSGTSPSPVACSAVAPVWVTTHLKCITQTENGLGYFSGPDQVAPGSTSQFSMVVGSVGSALCLIPHELPLSRDAQLGQFYVYAQNSGTAVSLFATGYRFER